MSLSAGAFVDALVSGSLLHRADMVRYYGPRIAYTDAPNASQAKNDLQKGLDSDSQ